MRLGVIGMSDGNGHPFSWSAICNGYSPIEMATCGFPVIPAYLSKQKWPEARLHGVEVSYVWTQNPTISHKISRAALIPNVVDTPEKMIGKIDGLLLARDDAENHLRFVTPFLKAGIPVYIDKPIALNIETLDAIYDLQMYDGQIFTCSALRFSSELEVTPRIRKHLGQIAHIEATAPKSWDRYAVHIIEPVLKIYGDAPIIRTRVGREFSDGVGRAVWSQFANGASARFMVLGSEVMAPFSFRIFGVEGWVDLFFTDAFTSFKNALSEFLDGIKTSSVKSPYAFNRKVVSIIERGRSV